MTFQKACLRKDIYAMPVLFSSFLFQLGAIHSSHLVFSILFAMFVQKEDIFGTEDAFWNIRLNSIGISWGEKKKYYTGNKQSVFCSCFVNALQSWCHSSAILIYSHSEKLFLLSVWPPNFWTLSNHWYKVITTFCRPSIIVPTAFSLQPKFLWPSAMRHNSHHFGSSLN